MVDSENRRVRMKRERDESIVVRRQKLRLFDGAFTTEEHRAEYDSEYGAQNIHQLHLSILDKLHEFIKVSKERLEFSSATCKEVESISFDSRYFEDFATAANNILKIYSTYSESVKALLASLSQA